MRKAAKILGKVLFYAWLLLLTAAVVLPFVWLILTALKPYPEIYAYPITYMPRKPTLDHFRHVFSINFWQYFWNSVRLGLGTAVLTVAIGVVPAYASTRFHFRGKNAMLLSILVCQMFPQIVFVVPFFFILKRLGLTDSFVGMMLAYLPFTTPVAVWMMKNFFADVPVELEESAEIDGCTRREAFVKISLPLAVPGIASVGIYAFMVSWSELMFALSYLSSPGRQSIPVFLSLFVGQYQTRWGPLFAGSVIASIPPILVFGLLQRYFMKGLMSGSVKG